MEPFRNFRCGVHDMIWSVHRFVDLKLYKDKECTDDIITGLIDWLFLGSCKLEQFPFCQFLCNGMGWSQQVVCMTYRSYPWVAPVHLYPIYYSEIWFCFTARKRFALHRDEESLRPSAVRLFPSVLSSTTISPAQPRRLKFKSYQPLVTDFCLRVPCIISPAKPNGRCNARITRKRA